MANRIEAPAVTVAANTAITIPTTTVLSWEPGIVERIEVFVPPGSSGLVGMRILHSGQQVIPFRSTDWIITDNEKISWDVEAFPTGNKWAVRAYNLDTYEHVWYFRFLIREFPIPATPRGLAVPIGPTLEQVAAE